jgi:hypothetical protein
MSPSFSRRSARPNRAGSSLPQTGGGLSLRNYQLFDANISIDRQHGGGISRSMALSSRSFAGVSPGHAVWDREASLACDRAKDLSSARPAMAASASMKIPAA